MKTKIIITTFLVLCIANFFIFYDVCKNSYAECITIKTNIYREQTKQALFSSTEFRLAVKEIEELAAIEQRKAAELASKQSSEHSIQPISEDGYLGKFRITRYCPCEKCCGFYALNRPTDENGNPVVYGASGRLLTSGYSCAADRSLPYGTKLYIPQIDMIVTVEDRAAKSIEERYDGQFVDLYFADHAHYIEGATDYMEVYIIQ